MDTFFIILRNVILFVALALPGYLLVKTKELSAQSSVALSKLLTYVGLPFMILNSMIQNVTFTPSLFLTLLGVAVLGVAFIVATYFISAPLTKREKDVLKRGTLRFGAVFPNNGFLGIPLAAAVFGTDSPVFTVLIILNIITNVTVYTFGIYLISGDRKNMSLKKAFFNPVLIAFVCGIVLNLVNIKSLIPEVATFAGHFSSTVAPVSMVILGMKMAEVDLKKLFASKPMYFASVLKLVVFPAAISLLLLAAKALFGDAFFSTDLIIAFFIAFAMPTAGLASTFADSFNGDTKGAVFYTFGTTLLSVVTIPVLYWVLCLILGI